MNRLKFIAYLFILSISSLNAQTINFSELKNIATSNGDQFNSFVLNKGYEYLSSEENRVTYYFDTFKTSKEKYVIGRITDENSSVTVFYMISRKSEYLSLKSQIDKDGFKFIETQNSTEGSHNLYQNESFVIDIFISDGIYKIYVRKVH